MVTNRDRKSFGSRRKNSKSCSDDWHRWRFDPRSGISGPTSRRASACPNLHEWWAQPAQVRCPECEINEMECSAIDLAEIRRSSKISSWIWSIISGVVTVLRRPRQGASQVEKSPRLNRTTLFLTVEYDGACFPNDFDRMAWISFGALPCRKRKTWWQLASRCCWNRARHLTCFLSASVTRKVLLFGTRTAPSFQRHYRFLSTTRGSKSG